MPHVAVDPTTIALLFMAFALALAFEAVNGCQDTSNAGATIIYTRSMKAPLAVVWSGTWNFLGVLLGGTAVAFTFVHLLPVSLLASLDTRLEVALIMRPRPAAVAWNVATWLLGIPVPSAHSLVDALLGVGVADIWESPPMWLQGILTVTCADFSFAHGSNDGQKTIGIHADPDEPGPRGIRHEPRADAAGADGAARGRASARREARRARRRGVRHRRRVAELPSRAQTIAEVPPADRAQLRADILTVTGAATAWAGDADRRQVGEWSTALLRVTEYAPTGALAITAICLGTGTMVGWKRVVVTVGEKIGKSELTPAQGSSAAIVAMATISLPDDGGCR